MTEPVTPQAQTADAFWPQDPGIERAVAGGVTTIQVLPGSGNLIGGRAVTIKLRPALSPRQMHVTGAPDGLKMACGENPKRAYGKDKRAPMTRMGNLALQRAAFLKARKLQTDWARWRDAESRRIATEAKKPRPTWPGRRSARHRDLLPRESCRRTYCLIEGVSRVDPGAAGHHLSRLRCLLHGRSCDARRHTVMGGLTSAARQHTARAALVIRPPRALRGSRDQGARARCAVHVIRALARAARFT